MTDLRYPIGKFRYSGPMDEADRQQAIDTIQSLPARLRATIEAFAEEQLDAAYRPGGWTVRQVVHHLADSHLNAYTRFKLALTEDEPTIRPYDEARWAELTDSRAAPDVSLRLLDALHERWVLLLRSLAREDWQKRVLHPEHKRDMSLDELLAMYAWHCSHHLAHITTMRERMGW
ncbi:MAG: putative metal-dependent hydrolase [Gemmatimonadetes bacterium]|nr:putative metal-dependent hydrolase [Gemmatimonadota bacterium]